MPDSIYNFGCTFAVRKNERLKITDMELAQLVLRFMKVRLLTGQDDLVTFLTETIHPIMIGPEGGTPVE